MFSNMNPIDNYTDDDLIKGCLKNNRKYQELLYKKYAKRMFSICKSFTDDNDDAKDILQDSFIKVFQKMLDYETSGSLEGWIRRIITNTAIDYYRKSTRLNKFIEDETKNHDKDVFTTDSVLSQINFEEVMNVVRTLPTGSRIIFNLFVVEGYTHEEIAEKLQISVGTSKSQVNRAKGILQKKLTDQKF